MMRNVYLRLLCLGLVFLGGCYSYRVVPPERIAPGTKVRARVAASEAGRLAEVLGREDRVLEGTLVGNESGALLLQVRGAGSSTNNPLYQRVTLPPAAIQEMEIRRLDRWRTFGLAGVLTAAAAFAVLQMPSDSETTGGEGGGTDAVRIPLWTIR